MREGDSIEGRPEYKPDPGLVAVQYGLGFDFEITPSFQFGGFLGAWDMTSSVVRDSPLVVSERGTSIGFAARWYFYQSSETVNILR